MITILRIGHRPARDKRITTHVGLVSRAFNADRMLVDAKDVKLEVTIQSVVDRFGGPFNVETDVAWRKIVRNWPGVIVHLTMYGEHIDEVIDKIFEKVPTLKDNELLIVVGSEKVPREIYEAANFNIAIGHQPHSEVAALAIFLDRLCKGTELNKEFNGKLRIIGSPNGKQVIENK